MSGPNSGSWRKGHIPWNAGKHGVQAGRVWTVEQRLAQSKLFKGRRNYWVTNAYKRGIKLTEEHKHKVSVSMRRARRTYAPIWNKGLTKETDARLAKLGRTMSRNTKGIPRPHRTSKQGIRRFWYYGKRCRLKMRSRWEVAYAHYLDMKRVKWLYEYCTFVMDKFSYTPDFYLPDTNVFHEVKGFVIGSAQEKLDKFVEHFGCELVVVGQKTLQSLGVLTAKGSVVMPYVR